jgi:hypothetical protein
MSTSSKTMENQARNSLSFMKDNSITLSTNKMCDDIQTNNMNKSNDDIV